MSHCCCANCTMHTYGHNYITKLYNIFTHSVRTDYSHSSFPPYLCLLRHIVSESDLGQRVFITKLPYLCCSSALSNLASITVLSEAKSSSSTSSSSSSSSSSRISGSSPLGHDCQADSRPEAKGHNGRQRTLRKYKVSGGTYK